MSEQIFKILVTGPFAAGKTSLIQSVSQTKVVSTDVFTTGDESVVKGETTVAMDFGTYRLDDGGDVQLLLFGTPGQPRFRFMTNILKGDVDVVAFVIDADATGTHAEPPQPPRPGQPRRLLGGGCGNARSGDDRVGLVEDR